MKQETMKVFKTCFLLLYVLVSFIPAVSQKRDSLQRVIHQGRPDTNRVNALYELSFSYVNLSPDSVLLYGKQALELATKLEFKEGMANAAYALGAGNFRKGNYDIALDHFKDCARIAGVTGNKSLGIKAFIGLGNVSFKRGNLAGAIENFHQGILLCEEIGDLPRLATLLNNVGSLHFNQGRGRDALGYFKRSLDIGYQLKDTSTLALAYSNISGVYKQLEVFDSAKVCTDSALYFAMKINDTYTQSLVWGVRGLIEYKSGNYEAALPFIRQSLNSFKASGNRAEVAELWNALGKIYLRKNDLDSSLYCYQNARTIAEAVGEHNYMRLSYEGLSDNYAARGDYKNAYQYLYKYLEAQNSFLDSVNIRKVTELNAKYESVSRQRKIELLEKDKIIQQTISDRERIIRKTLIAGVLFLIVFLLFTFYRYRQRRLLNEKLARSMDELKQMQQQLIETEKRNEQENVRLRISRDIHDEIGGNLTKIALLSENLSSEVKGYETETSQTLDRISEYAHSVNRSLGEIIWSVNPTQDTLESLVAYMRHYIHLFLQDTGIQYKMNFPENFDNCHLDPDLKRTLFLVLKEALNNCVKHSKAKNIGINFLLNRTHFELSIKDDGIGFKSLTSYEKEAVQPGINSSGNGLRNMEFRMKSQDCIFEISSSPGEGCMVLASGNLVN